MTKLTFSTALLAPLLLLALSSAAVFGQERTPVVSWDLMVGVWHIDRVDGKGSHWVSRVEYFSDGQYEGYDVFDGRRVRASGEWKFERLSDTTFRLSGAPNETQAWSAVFKVLDRNHIENLDMNYVVDRVR